MTKHELASFTLKLLGIYAIIESLPLFQFFGGLAYALQLDRSGPVADFWPSLIMLMPLLMVAAVGVVLVAFSRNLAPLLVGKDGPLGMSSVLTGHDVQAIGFSIVAVLIFLRALPQMGQAYWAVFDAFSRRYSEPASGRIVQNFFRYGIPAVIQLVLAVVLFLQARGLSDLWHRIRIGRYGSVEDAEQKEVPPGREGQ